MKCLRCGNELTTNKKVQMLNSFPTGDKYYEFKLYECDCGWVELQRPKGGDSQ